MIELKADKIYFLGPEGSYSHKALEGFCDLFEIKANDKQPVKTIKGVLKAVDLDKNSFGVIPIENSIEGIVREAIDNLIKVEDHDFRIMGEFNLSVDHCLLSKASNIKEITTVISHPQALAQCSNYLETNLGEIQTLESTSTSAAAKQVAKQGASYAAISNELAAKFFDLNVLDKSINDEKDNQTRFLLIGRVSMPQTGFDKTSIAFSTKNTAGALFKVLEVFNKYELNLSYIDSRPSKKNLGEYNFFIDFEGHCDDSKVEMALSEIKPYVSFFRNNGSFPRYKK